VAYSRLGCGLGLRADAEGERTVADGEGKSTVFGSTTARRDARS